MHLYVFWRNDPVIFIVLFRGAVQFFFFVHGFKAFDTHFQGVRRKFRENKENTNGSWKRISCKNEASKGASNDVVVFLKRF